MSSLPKKAKVVIIGAGIHGLSTAWHLSQKYQERKRCCCFRKIFYCCWSKWNCMWSSKK